MSRRRAEADDQSDSSAEGGPSSQGLSSVQLPKAHDSLRHLFLQAFLSQRLVPHAQAKLIYKECARACQVAEAESFEDFVANLEPQLALIGLDLKAEADQETGVPFLALVNTISDSMSKLSTELSAAQLVFFRLVVEKIMTAPKMKYAVTVKDASKCAKDKSIVPAMSYVQAEALLKSLVFKGWLTYNKGRWLTLAPRSTTELAPYLRDKYGADDEEDVDPEDVGFVVCQQCRSIVTSGWSCPNSECGVRLHRHCASGALTARSGTCPASINDPTACTQKWLGGPPGKWSGTPVGLLALRDVDEHGDQLASDDDDDEAETEQTQEPPAQSQPRSQSTALPTPSRRSVPARETGTPSTATKRSAPASTAASGAPTTRTRRRIADSSSDASESESE